MPLRAVSPTCKVEVYGPDEDGTRIICASIVDCPLGHAGEIGLDCFGAGNAGRTDAVAGPVATTTQEVRPEGGDPPVKTSGHAPDIPAAEPRAGNTANRERVLVKGQTDYIARKETETERSESLSGAGEQGRIGDSNSKSERPSFVGSITSGGIPAAVPDSHMVVGKDTRREEMVQKYVDKLNEISMEMYLESKSSGPPPIPILGPKETEEFLDKLDNFKLTPEQMEFYRDARRKFPADKFSSLSHWEPEVYDAMMRRQNRRLKRRKRYMVKANRSGGMIRMPGNKPEPPEPEEESLFEVDEKDYGPAAPTVKPESELQKSPPKVERPDEPEEQDEEEDDKVETAEGVLDDSWEQIIEEFETENIGYVCGLEVFTDEDGDHVVTLTLDNLSIDIMLTDFLEILDAFDKVKPKLQKIFET